MWVRPGDSRAASNVRDVGASLSYRRPGRCRLDRKLARLVALGQDFDGEIRTEALAQAAADAVRRLDDGVMGQQEAVFWADLDADVAALAPLVDPPDVDVVNDGGLPMRATFGRVESCRSLTPGFRANRRGAGP
jgi:hypothetical protein